MLSDQYGDGVSGCSYEVVGQAVPNSSDQGIELDDGGVIESRTRAAPSAAGTRTGTARKCGSPTPRATRSGRGCSAMPTAARRGSAPSRPTSGTSPTPPVSRLLTVRAGTGGRTGSWMSPVSIAGVPVPAPHRPLGRGVRQRIGQAV